ncbi:MAG TPA: hypothetical protein VF601_08955 [Beijerinckiaceae bacterium]|jgi:hypothetical protein
MPVTAILRGAAGALLFSLAAISTASADYRAGYAGPFYGPPARMRVQPHRAGPMRPALRHGHGIEGHHGHVRGGHGHRHHGLAHQAVHGPRHHAARMFFPRDHRHALQGPRFHGPAYGHLARKRFFRMSGYGLYARPGYHHGYAAAYGHGYGAAYARPAYGSYAYYPTLAYGTVAGAAPYGPLYNRPVCICY